MNFDVIDFVDGSFNANNSLSLFSDMSSLVFFFNIYHNWLLHWPTAWTPVLEVTQMSRAWHTPEATLCKPALGCWLRSGRSIIALCDVTKTRFPNVSCRDKKGLLWACRPAVGRLPVKRPHDCLQSGCRASGEINTCACWPLWFPTWPNSAAQPPSQSLFSFSKTLLLRFYFQSLCQFNLNCCRVYIFLFLPPLPSSPHRWVRVHCPVVSTVQQFCQWAPWTDN